VLESLAYSADNRGRKGSEEMKQQPTTFEMHGHTFEMTARGVPIPADDESPPCRAPFYFETIFTVDGHAVYNGPYSVGSGIVENFLKETRPRLYKGMFRGRRTIADEEILNEVRADTIRGKTMFHYGSIGRHPIFAPNVVDLAECLFMDAIGIDAFTTFSEWALELGYSDDSIKAKSTFETCQQISAKMRQALGKDFEKIAQEIGDLDR
jgi:hypothetical protein